jgi:hypothetical protein
VRICRVLWRKGDFAPQPVPDRLTACVKAGGGHIVVYPGGPEECARNDAAPYRGVTPEQKRFAAFREDLADEVGDRTCVPYPELRDTVGTLLDRHGLTGWRTEHFRTADREPQGPCAEVTLYKEAERTVYLGDNPEGDPTDT